MSLRVASLDYLGIVASRLRKDAVSSRLNEEIITDIIVRVCQLLCVISLHIYSLSPPHNQELCSIPHIYIYSILSTILAYLLFFLSKHTQCASQINISCRSLFITTVWAGTLLLLPFFAFAASNICNVLPSPLCFSRSYPHFVTLKLIRSSYVSLHSGSGRWGEVAVIKVSLYAIWSIIGMSARKDLGLLRESFHYDITLIS